MIDSVYRKDQNYYSKVFLEKYYFIEDMKIYCSNSDEEYHDEECTNLFFDIFFRINFSNLGLKSAPVSYILYSFKIYYSAISILTEIA